MPLWVTYPNGRGAFQLETQRVSRKPFSFFVFVFCVSTMLLHSGCVGVASPASNQMPVIKTQPASQMVSAGQTATFSVAADGNAPLLYQWERNGTPIAGAASSSYTTPPTTTADNSSRFVVIISDKAGSVTSNPATLTVTTANVAPSLISQPVDQTVTAGQTATFSVTASGTAPLSYQWFKNGAAIGTATSPTYTTPAETTSDNGARFTVTVSNAAGSVTSAAATLTVTAGAAAPLIVSQPVSQSITAGQTATFSVTASGTAPLSYQWYKNGAAVGGATSPTYTTPAETTSDNGAQFTVVVSNSVGKVTSTAAALTVNAATFLLSATPASLTFGNVNTGASSTLAVTLTNSGNSQVTISNVSISGAGFNASGLSAGQILAPGQGGTLNVTFTPAVAGSVTGSLAVVSSASNSPATIPLSGTGSQTVPHSADLSWTASTSIVAGYNVYRGVQSGGPYTKLTSTPVVLTIHTDSTVQSGQTYFYVVTAVDLNNLETVHSNEVSAVIP